MEYIKTAKDDCLQIKRNLLIINNKDFFSSIAKRGKEYFEQKKVKDIKRVNDNTYSAVVAGSKNYYVTAKIKGTSYIDAECTCSFYRSHDENSNSKLCKHIYAVNMAICDLENKRYINNCLIEYTEKYIFLYTKLLNKNNNFKLTNEEIEVCKENDKEFISLYEKTKNIIDTDFNVQTAFDSLCEFINKSGKILNNIECINTLYENQVIEYITKDTSEQIKNNENNNIGKSKEHIIIKILKVLGAIILGIFTGFNLSDNSENNSEEENGFSYGDIVIVKYSGKVGEIIAVDNNYYTVKLRDEFEKEYYASYNANELESYY